MSEVQNDYLVGGNSNYTFKAGANKDCKVKSWSIETNDNNGKTSYYLKITYVQPVAGVDPEEWSTINELLNFPGFPKDKTEISKNTVRYGFVNPLKGFCSNFASQQDIDNRIVAVFGKLGLDKQGNDFTRTDEAKAHQEFKVLVEGLFNLIESKGLFQLEGTLVCGFANPKVDNEGKVKQFLQPAKYGQSGCYQPAFRTSNNEELPAEKTEGFKDDIEKKYQYWSYTRTKSNSGNDTVSESVATTVASAGDAW